MPVIVKITPNYGEAEVLVKYALENGAKAVTLTNTMPTLADPLPSGAPYNAVGKAKHYNSGGTTGSILRPIALRKTADVAKIFPNV